MCQIRVLCAPRNSSPVRRGIFRGDPTGNTGVYLRRAQKSKLFCSAPCYRTLRVRLSGESYQIKIPYLKAEYFYLVTLIYPIYKDVVDEVVRWNVALKGLALSREARSQ